MIVVRIGGGLGNQMFQYAAAKALSLRSGQRLALDLSWVQADPLRSYSLHVFNITAAPLGPLGKFCKRLRASPRKAKLIAAALNRFFPPFRQPVMRDAQKGFDPAVYNLKGNACLDGYWQSEQYFSDCLDMIRSEFTFRQPPDSANLEMISRIGQVTAVSVHVRRGDMANDPKTHAYHGLSSLDYYRQAIDHIRQSVASPHLFFFSDDLAWTRDNLRVDIPATYVDLNSGQAGHQDMRLMTHCKHFILANSSFSWWGAWLAQAPGKIVIAPKHWFADRNASDKDIVPPEWIRL